MTSSSTELTLTPTKLEYFDDMWALQSRAILLSLHQVRFFFFFSKTLIFWLLKKPNYSRKLDPKAEDGRRALILDSTIFHPQGGGQPADAGFVAGSTSGAKFVVDDVRSKDGLVLHYGHFENCQDGSGPSLKEGEEVSLHVDAQRRDFNSRQTSFSWALVGYLHAKSGLILSRARKRLPFLRRAIC
ncbi:uncharacterized protein M6B38_291230 [Iris pallida]|uniref:Alanyl-tRNA synthetase class IIc N-terminal domain-containing protein n=1 Tax=Iris pallida TaxID=29817 RepID=A0AAX6HSX1_IRIPA|nr:uncharacterized protein M6B38_291230 [Iris pallida]